MLKVCDDFLKALGCVAVVASVVGYIVICHMLSSYGIVEPALLSTKMVAAGLLCLLLFAVPSVAIPLTRYNLNKAGFCFSTEDIVTRKRAGAGLRIFNSLLYELELTLSCAFAFSILISSSGLIGLNTHVKLYCLSSAMLLLLSYSLQLNCLSRRAYIGNPAWTLYLVSLATLVFVVVVSLLFWPKFYYNVTGGFPLSHPLKFAIGNALLTYLYMRFRRTLFGFFTMALFVIAICAIPIYSGRFYGWMWSAWGGGQEAPVWLSLEKRSGVLESCTLQGELIYETDSSVYSHLSHTAHLAYQIPRSAISGIYFRRSLPFGADKQSDDNDPSPYAQPLDQVCSGGFNMGTAAHP